MANKKLSALITIGGAVSGTLGAAFNVLRGETSKVGAAVQQLTARQRELNAELSKSGRDGVRGADLRLQYARQELAIIGQQITRLRARQAIEQAQKSNAAKRSEITGKIGETVAVAATVGATLGLAVKEAADFDYQMQLIGNTADMTTQEISKLRRGILDTSKETRQSATNIQKGMGYLIAAGMEPIRAREFLGNIGKTATATAADVEDLSKMVFTLNDSLKIGPEGMSGAIDTLAQAGKEGNVELKDMAKQLPVLGAGFVSLKMEGREAAATMGAALQIARKGAADADEAANNMKNFIAKIMSPETLKKAKKNFNLDLYKIITDAQSKGQNPFEKSMEAIIMATKGDQKAIGELFQDMQVQNFLRPMIQQWDKYKEIKDKALSANGLIDRDFEKMLTTTKQQILELGQAFGRLGVAIGAALNGGSNGSRTLAQSIDALAEYVNTNKEFIGTAIKVAGSLVGLRLAWLGLGWALTVANGAWLAMRAAWLMAPGILSAVGVALRFVGTSLLWVGRALLLNPIGLAVTAIAGAAFLIYKYWEPIKGFFINLWEGVKSSFASAYDWIVGKIAKVAGWFGISMQSNAAPIAAPPKPSLPSVPQMAARGGSMLADNSQTTFNITQQPGQDSKALADEIMRKMRERQGVRGRSIMFDGVGAQ